MPSEARKLTAPCLQKLSYFLLLIQFSIIEIRNYYAETTSFALCLLKGVLTQEYETIMFLLE